MANKEELTAMLREKNYAKLANFETVTIFDGLASFVDGNTVKITSLNEEIFVAGDRFIINTGAKAFIPDIPGVHESKHVHISDGILELKTCRNGWPSSGRATSDSNSPAIYAIRDPSDHLSE